MWLPPPPLRLDSCPEGKNQRLHLGIAGLFTHIFNTLLPLPAPTSHDDGTRSIKAVPACMDPSPGMTLAPAGVCRACVDSY